MNDLIDRDTVELARFGQKLSDFCDSLDHKRATLLRMEQEAAAAMQDQGGRVLSQRLILRAEELEKRVAQGRALAGRIRASVWLLEQSEEE